LINKRKIHTNLFVVTDAISASVAWTLFFAFRKTIIEPDKFGYKIPIELDQNFYFALCLVPVYWFVLYYLSGHYKDVWRKSRIHEISKTFTASIIGVVCLFFLLLIDDEVKSYQSYYKSTLTLFLLHDGITTFVRLLQAYFVKHAIKSGRIGFQTLVVGNDAKSYQIVKELKAAVLNEGYIFKGFVCNAADEANHKLNEFMPFLGHYENLPALVKQYQIEEVIIGIDSKNHEELNHVTNILEDLPVSLKIIPDLYDMVSGQVRMNNIIGTALIEINHEVMPQWQIVLKRFLDIVVSLLVVVFFSPIFLIIALLVLMSSKGPVFFRQERLGFHAKPFKILKFRTMFIDAEQAGPQLSSTHDPRITPIGKFLRKYRLDEIPQFFNVLIGEMSLVGPRPERKFFADQIVKIAPHYKHLHRVKPGITSWGQVKYGYAENVEQMVERLKFDILYIENRSIAVDLRVLIYTVLTILQGRGK
jgi:exopolysaccharide biosynthesis polyprenyl glycosylphosphotransferase